VSTAADAGVWNADGYYFASATEKSWTELSEVIAKEGAKEGLLKTAGLRSASKEEFAELIGDGTLFGCSCRHVADRAREELGWVPKGWSPEEETVRVLKEEGKAFKSEA